MRQRTSSLPRRPARRSTPPGSTNARAHPEVRLNGQPFRAEIVADEAARAQLWELADRVFPPFAGYRESAGRSGRVIPILRLVRRPDESADSA